MDRMDFRQLEMFQAVAENLSFTIAGQKLYVAQSAISRKIRLLEEELGERLFKRVNKRVFLTPAGEVMLGYTRRVFKELRNAVLEVSELSSMNRGTIRIGGGMTACMYILPPVIDRFQAKYPKVEVQVVTGPAEVLVPQIRNAIIDIGVVTLPVTSSDLEVIPFTTEEMVVVASRKNRSLARRNSMSAAEIEKYPLITFSKSASTRTILDAYFDRIGIHPRIVTESESVATIKPLVGVNLGISILPLPSVAAERKRGELHVLRIRDHKCIREIGLVTHRTDYQPRVITELIELFRTTRKVQLSTRRD
jgi:DNA-binding transcriptional LysR family regulator